MAQTAVNTTNLISKTLLNKVIGGEKPKKLETPTLGVEIAKTEPDKMPASYQVNGGGVKVSSEMSSLVSKSTEVTN